MAATTPPSAEIIFRAAAAADQKAITAFIRAAQINPMNLHWQNFLLAVDAATGRIAATGQIKIHGDGSRELASIATQPEYQRRGLARSIIQRLIEKDAAESTAPLYLTCVSDMGAFYMPFGFRVVEDLAAMPPYFRRVKRVVRLMRVLARNDMTLLVMKREHVPPAGA